jgi:uncharacterized phiE125 gp8 family phage protein
MILPTTAATAEPVLLHEARAQCRIDDDITEFDSRLEAYIVAARALAEKELKRRLISQTWDLWLDEFPEGDDIELPQNPVSAITSITYVDTAGATQTISSGNYRLDTRKAKAIVRPAFNVEWPSDVRDDYSVIDIKYVVGFGANGTTVPRSIREWILLHVAAMYENGTAIGDARDMAVLPYLSGLLDEWRVYG